MRTQVHRKLSFLPLAVIAATGLLACATPRTEVPVPIGATIEDAARLAEGGRTGEAASMYAGIADRSAGRRASQMRLEAAELWWVAGEPERVRTQLSRIEPDSFDADGAARLGVLAAVLAMHDGHPADALARLPSDLSVLDRETAARALAVRADAALALDDQASAIADLVRRESMLSGPEAIDENRERIWAAIRRTDGAQLVGDDPLLDGWLALAELRRRAWHDPSSFEDAARQWRARFPMHPAGDRFLPQLIREQRALAGGVTSITVLLPLSGRFATAAAAVRDGLLSAHFRGTDPQRRPRIRILDTGDGPEAAVAHYRTAVADGADFVIGPLQKETVAAIARLHELPIPVLALNTLDGTVVPDGMFQFGLVPEDEAEQIAERVHLEGHEFGIALVPDNELGLRMLQTFQLRFEELGGTLLEAQFYDPSEQDHTAPIIRTLGIDESRSRHRILRTVLNADLIAEPRRRRDAEFVYMVATPEQGRLLRPQLRFHHASDLPVYASSHLYTGVPDRSRDSDMDGVAFTDMPWTIAPDTTVSEVKRELATHLSAALERNPRLFALGYDAYRLAPVLRHEPDLLRQPVPAATGSLHLDDEHRIHREMTWAIFRGGVPHQLQAPAIADFALETPAPIP